jgi:asparagine synthetase B (glutamine-hydrolysing)
MVSGQGPDELFAGYEKHVRLFMDKGESALDNELRSEIKNTNRVNIERDEKAIAYNGLSAFFPYLNSQFMFEALTVPSRWKVTLGKNPERKVIFRELAINMGLPEEIALSPKKATQYSSGSQRIIRRAISEKVKSLPESQIKKKGALAQIVMDRIARELGMPIQSRSDVELDFDLGPVRRLVKEIQRTSRQQ